MLEKVHNITVDTDDVFEELIKKDGYELNHVIVKPGKMFPAHPTDANVTIIVVQGELSLKLGNQELMTYKKGTVVEVEKGTMSSLGNGSGKILELFVIKTLREI